MGGNFFFFNNFFLPSSPHGDAHLGALDACDEAGTLQLDPVRLVELRTDEEVEVGDLVVFAEERRGQAELRVRLHRGEDAPEHLRRDVLHLWSENDDEDDVRSAEERREEGGTADRQRAMFFNIIFFKC